MDFNVVYALTDGSKDLLPLVLKKLPTKGRLQARLVCKRWRDAVKGLIIRLGSECQRITRELSCAFPMLREFSIKEPVRLSFFVFALDDRIRNVKVLHISSKLQKGEFTYCIPRFSNLETLKILKQPSKELELAAPLEEFGSLAALSSSLRSLGVYARGFDFSVLPFLANLDTLEFFSVPDNGKVEPLLEAACGCKKLRTLRIDTNHAFEEESLEESLETDVLQKLFDSCPDLVNLEIPDSTVPRAVWPWLIRRPLEHLECDIPLKDVYPYLVSEGGGEMHSFPDGATFLLHRKFHFESKDTNILASLQIKSLFVEFEPDDPNQYFVRLGEVFGATLTRLFIRSDLVFDNDGEPLLLRLKGDGMANAFPHLIAVDVESPFLSAAAPWGNITELVLNNMDDLNFGNGFKQDISWQQLSDALPHLRTLDVSYDPLLIQLLSTTTEKSVLFPKLATFVTWYPYVTLWPSQKPDLAWCEYPALSLEDRVVYIGTLSLLARSLPIDWNRPIREAQGTGHYTLAVELHGIVATTLLNRALMALVKIGFARGLDVAWGSSYQLSNKPGSRQCRDLLAAYNSKNLDFPLEVVDPIVNTPHNWRE